jgi:hypothetical protein
VSRGIRADGPRTRRAVARTATPRHAHRHEYVSHGHGRGLPRFTASGRLPCGSFRRVNAFHVCGIVFAAWALLVSFLGITRENFPGSPAGGRAVAAISVILAAAAIGTGIYTSATEEEEEHEGEDAAAVLPT